MTDLEEQYLTPKQAAAAAKVNVRTIRRWAAGRQITAFGRPLRPLYRLSEIQAVINVGENAVPLNQ